ncbi:MAG TPA: glycosyltransferase family 4 protein [Bryobacteraceae bacterium]|nr:glycosyltransferase family 4 protein [Bryobacteraceae bacterium]
MRIAQVAPLYESVPPLLYGGTERVVSHLVEELVRQGNDVTLFASGDSTTSATLVPACRRALRLDSNCQDSLALHMVMLDEVFRRKNDFDMIHFHVDYLHFPISSRLRVPNITTLHGRLDLPELAAVYRQFPDMPVVSISDAQRQPLPNANWLATVYHGVPAKLLSLQPEPGDYLAFLGRISPEKGVDRAIEVAKRVEMPLRIAAKVDKVDKEYFEAEIKPLLDHPLIEYIGEISESEKQDFLGGACALLFLIDWPEPFGLAMIEAMACGTPVIAFRRGSVPEIVAQGITGFIVHNDREAADAVGKIRNISRAGCRNAFEQRFTASRMAADYVDVYNTVQSGDAPLLSIRLQ